MSTTSILNRRLDMAGEIKQARAVVAECDREVEVKTQALVSAQNTAAAATARLETLYAEREELAAQAHADVLRAGEDAEPLPGAQAPPTQPTGDPGAIAWEFNPALAALRPAIDAASMSPEAFAAAIHETDNQRLAGVFDSAPNGHIGLRRDEPLF